MELLSVLLEMPDAISSPKLVLIGLIVLMGRVRDEIPQSDLSLTAVALIVVAVALVVATAVLITIGQRGEEIGIDGNFAFSPIVSAFTDPYIAAGITGRRDKDDTIQVIGGYPIVVAELLSVLLEMPDAIFNPELIFIGLFVLVRCVGHQVSQGNVSTLMGCVVVCVAILRVIFLGAFISLVRIGQRSKEIRIDGNFTVIPASIAFTDPNIAMDVLDSGDKEDRIQIGRAHQVVIF